MVSTTLVLVTDDRFPGLIALLLERNSRLPRVSLEAATGVRGLDAYLTVLENDAHVVGAQGRTDGLGKDDQRFSP